MPLATALFDYELPDRLIAQEPAARRDRSRLLVVDRSTRKLSHRTFAELPEILRPGDTLIRNRARVLPARLKAKRPSGARVECLLLESVGSDVWRCLLKPGRRLPQGAVIVEPGGAFRAEVLTWEPDGVAVVSFTTRDREPLAELASRLGEMPLPPYIARSDKARAALDRERYQTVYADPERTVAAAAPTAGLHFTAELLAELVSKGIGTADLTLHVGLGTFRPIAAETIEAHAIHRERYEIPAATQRALFRPPGPAAGRRVAVGTTSVRTIEDFLAKYPAPLDHPVVSEAAIYLHPPGKFRGVDALITNFHQPRSTLLCLVAAFLAPGSIDGVAWLREIYREAIAREYRFFSYGDAMLIL
jgi:S-adenosylmethionine:tRNA ribosyltransferase-isomerase